MNGDILIVHYLLLVFLFLISVFNLENYFLIGVELLKWIMVDKIKFKCGVFISVYINHVILLPHLKLRTKMF